MYDLYVTEIDHKSIVNKDLKSLQEILRFLEREPKAYHKNAHITFGGFEADPREIFEIQEIRDWCMEAVKRHPEIFYYLEDRMECQKNFLVCIANIRAYKMDHRQLDEVIRNNPNEPTERILINISLPFHLFETISIGLIHYDKVVNDFERIQLLIKDLSVFTPREK